MEFKLVKQVVESIQKTIESAAVAAVTALKAHVFSVKVKNFPRVQRVKGTVTLSRQKSIEKELKMINKNLVSLEKAIKGLKTPAGGGDSKKK